MRPVAAIVETAIDIRQIARDVQSAFVALQGAERDEAAAESRHAAARDAAVTARLELGRQLIIAKRSIKHGGWLPFIEKQGITSQSASNWMRLAGYAGEQSKLPSSNGHAGNSPVAPTLADAGIDKRPRKRDERPRDEQRQPSLDVSRELSRLHDKIFSFVESVPPKWRQSIAEQLRETARLIEEM